MSLNLDLALKCYNFLVKWLNASKSLVVIEDVIRQGEEGYFFGKDGAQIFQVYLNQEGGEYHEILYDPPKELVIAIGILAKEIISYCEPEMQDPGQLIYNFLRAQSDDSSGQYDIVPYIDNRLTFHFQPDQLKAPYLPNALKLTEEVFQRELREFLHDLQEYVFEPLSKITEVEYVRLKDEGEQKEAVSEKKVGGSDGD